MCYPRPNARQWTCLAALLAFAPAASANSGFPMIFNTLPLMLLALIPLLLFEAALIVRSTGAAFGTTARATAGANLLSTLIGLPLSNALGVLLAWASHRTGINGYDGTDAVANTVLKATLGFVWLDPYQWLQDNTGRVILPLPEEPAWYYHLQSPSPSPSITWSHGAWSTAICSVASPWKPIP